MRAREATPGAKLSVVALANPTRASRRADNASIPAEISVVHEGIARLSQTNVEDILGWRRQFSASVVHSSSWRRGGLHDHHPGNVGKKRVHRHHSLRPELWKA